jgi:hypothetical protein
MIRLVLLVLFALSFGAIHASAPEEKRNEVLVRHSAVGQWSTNALSISPTSLSGFTTALGSFSAYQTILISGTGLSGNVTVTVPTGFEASWIATGSYTSTLTLTQSGGVVTNVPLHVRLTGTNLGTYSGNVTIATSGNSTENVSVSGTVTAAPTPNPIPVLTSMSPTSGGNSAPLLLDLHGSDFVPGVTVSMGGSIVYSTTFLSASHLQALVSLPARTTPLPTQVTVTNPAPGGGTSNALTFTVQPAAPVITSFSPSSGPVGTEVTIRGFNLYLFSGSFSTTFNGTAASSIGPPTPSQIEVVARVPVGATTGLITLANANGAAVSATPFVVTATPPPFFEDFERGTKSSYTPASVALASGGWTFNESLIGTTDGADKFNNTRSARLRGAGYVEMDTDKPNGAGVVTVSAATYSTETGVSFIPEISIDGGVTYTSLLTGPPPVLTPNLTTYSFTANRAGNIRLRFSSTNTNASTNPRICLDDIGITNHVVTSALNSKGAPTLQVYPNPTSGVVTVAPDYVGRVQVALFDLTGRLVQPSMELNNSHQFEIPKSLPAGSYLLQVHFQKEQRTVRVVKL